MRASEDHLRPAAWIPWVCVLVALVGCHVLQPDLAQARKGRDLEACSLAQVTGDCPGPEAQPQAGPVLVPPVAGGFHPAVPPSRLLEIEGGGLAAGTAVRHGTAQGRAPPRIRGV